MTAWANASPAAAVCATICAVIASNLPPGQGQQRGTSFQLSSSSFVSSSASAPRHDRPPGRLSLHAAAPAAGAGRTAGPHDHVADLAGHAVGAAPDAAAQHPAAADPRADGDVEQARQPGPAPKRHSPNAATLASLSTAAGAPARPGAGRPGGSPPSRGTWCDSRTRPRRIHRTAETPADRARRPGTCVNGPRAIRSIVAWS